MIRHRTLAFGLLAGALAGLGACTSAAEDHSTAELRETDLTSADSILGADRVGDILRKDTSKIPTNLAEVEAMFGVGRSCARPDSKEIYIVEETHGRKPDGTVIGEDAPIPLLPRAVITGCNTGRLSNATTFSESYGFFIALVSDPDRAHATTGDGMLLESVEVMTYDREIGTYNFYIFGRGAAGQPQLRRIFRNDDGTVVQRSLDAGATVSSAPGETTAKCFSCHVNGDPFMNEMRDPWTNWISFKKSTGISVASGATKELVSEAPPNPATGRSSLANDLEPVMRAGIRAHVANGERGFAPRLAKKPGGVGQLFDSVFCETELNFATSTDAIPMEAYLEPDLAGDLVTPSSFSIGPFQLPIRAEFDHAVERWLENTGYLTRSLTQAIRLLDDENDVFSTARCAPFRSSLRAELVAAGAPTADAAREIVARHVAARIADATFAGSHPKRLALAKLLLDATATPEALRAAHAAYATELASRFATLTADPARITQREADRKARAIAMFPAPSSPLPLMTLR